MLHFIGYFSIVGGKIVFVGDDYEIKNGVLMGYKGKSSDIIIPEGVIAIAEGAFIYPKEDMMMNDFLASIGLKSIYEHRSYARITGITVPVSLALINKRIFTRNSYDVTDIYVKDLSAWCKIKGLVSFMIEPDDERTDSLPSIWCEKHLHLNDSIVKNLVIPNSVTVIEDYAFCGFSDIVNVIFPHSLMSIGSSAFSYCGGLTSITFPNNVMSIGSHALQECKNLSDVVLPNSLILIEDGVFSHCSKLTNIIIPDGVRSIGKHAFIFCKELSSVVIPCSVQFIGDAAFCFCVKLKIIQYKGTKNQWNQINKCSRWNYKSIATEVSCLDGVVEL